MTASVCPGLNQLRGFMGSIRQLDCEDPHASRTAGDHDELIASYLFRFGDKLLIAVVIWDPRGGLARFGKQDRGSAQHERSRAEPRSIAFDAWRCVLHNECPIGSAV